MSAILHTISSRRLRAFVAVAALLSTAFLAATATQVAAAGEPPCPSCPDRMPPTGGGGSAGQGNAGQGSSGAPAQAVQPLISLGPITVSGGVASLTGVVNGVSAIANVNVSVDTLPVAVNVGGTFAAHVDLGVHASIVVRARDRSSGQSIRISIPTSSIPANGTLADALVQLDADAITLLMPVDGFMSVDGNAVEAGIHVGGIAGLAKLDLNGLNLLARLRIGSKASGSGSDAPSAPSGASGSSSSSSAPPPCRHTAWASVPAKGSTVALTVTGTNGVSQVSTIPVGRISSVVHLGREFSISAFGARGIRISSVRLDARQVARTHHVAVAVTVRDRRHYLVRDAVVMLVPVKHAASVHGSVAGLSNLLGRARFMVPVSSVVLGRRFTLTVVARTPLATTRVTRSVVLGRAA